MLLIYQWRNHIHFGCPQEPAGGRSGNRDEEDIEMVSKREFPGVPKDVTPPNVGMNDIFRSAWSYFDLQVQALGLVTWPQQIVLCLAATVSNK
jgi:hypothetical protein